jgi:serine/threonine protein phosphatase 1
MVYNSTMEQQGILLKDKPLGADDVVVIGDIHGCAWGLRELISQVINTGCTLVFVGDLIDRGEEGAAVLTIVKDLHSNPKKWGLKAVHVLRGNHEQMILDAKKEEESIGWRISGDYSLWLRNGGKGEDYEFIDQQGMWDWLESLPLYYEHPRLITWGEEDLTLLVTHASVFPGVPLNEQEPEVLYWDRHIRGFSEKHLTVHGHTIQESGNPMIYDTPTGKVIRLDTGSYITGIVTGVAFTEKE